MSTRSGRSYKPVSDTMTEDAGSIADLMKVLIEDRRSREAQYNEEKRSQQEAVELERAQMREQLEMLHRLVESRQADEKRPPATQTTSESEVKLVKLSEQDNIESYFRAHHACIRGEGGKVGGKTGSAVDG